MPAPLLYQMFKSKSKYPLHRAIKAHREDVVFLYVVEFSSQVRKYFELNLSVPVEGSCGTFE